MATLDRLVPPAVLPSEGPAWKPRRAIAVAIIAAAAIALLQVFQSSGLVNTGETLQRLEREQAERQARERLGMIPARNIVYLDVAAEAPTGPLLPRPYGEQAAPQAASPAQEPSLLQKLLSITPFD